MHFPQSTSTGNYVPFQRQIPGRIFRKPAHPESPSHFGRIRARNHRPIRPPINKEASSRTAGHEVHREFRTQRRPLNVAFVLRRTVEQGTSCPDAREDVSFRKMDRPPSAMGNWFVCPSREPYIPRRRADASVLKRGLSWRHLLNIYKLKATSCGLLCTRKPCPRIHVRSGMQFPLTAPLGNCIPLRAQIVGRTFRNPIHPESPSHSAYIQRTHASVSSRTVSSSG